jgi:Cornichon protein
MNGYCVLLLTFQLIAFDELKTDYKNPIDQCNSLNPVCSLFLCYFFLLIYSIVIEPCWLIFDNYTVCSFNSLQLLLCHYNNCASNHEILKYTSSAAYKSLFSGSDIIILSCVRICYLLPMKTILQILNIVRGVIRHVPCLMFVNVVKAVCMLAARGILAHRVKDNRQYAKFAH